jgi:hypothetical protein
LATYFATSTSKPLNEPSGFFSARPGWSNLMPTTSLPAFASVRSLELPDAAPDPTADEADEEPAADDPAADEGADEAAAGLVAAAVEDPDVLPEAAGVLELPQALATRATTEAPAASRPNRRRWGRERTGVIETSFRSRVPDGPAPVVECGTARAATAVQWGRILDRKSRARDDFGAVKKSSGPASSTISPSAMNTTRSAARRAKPIS